MSEELLHIFDEGQCLSEQQLLDYLQNKLSEQEKHTVEEHLATCEFCSEALEGLAAIQHKERIPLIVRQLQNQMRRELRLHRDKNKKTRYYVSLSLVVLIIIIILLVAFFVMQHNLHRHPHPSVPPIENKLQEP